MNTKYIVTFLYAPFGCENDIKGINNFISQMDGVKNVASNQHVKSVVDIEYDPQSISSSFIVNRIKQQGAHVALIAI
jgi:copper chaperone CopZ